MSRNHDIHGNQQDHDIERDRLNEMFRDQIRIKYGQQNNPVKKPFVNEKQDYIDSFYLDEITDAEFELIPFREKDKNGQM